MPFVFGGDGATFAVPDALREGSFEGFECRWQGVPSFRRHRLALLVAAVSGDADANLASYRGVSDKIAQIYGDVCSYHPLRTEHMRLSFSPRQLGHEWRVRSSRLSLWGWVNYFARMILLDGMLRMVMDGSDGGYALAARGLKAQLESLRA